MRSWLVTLTLVTSIALQANGSVAWAEDDPVGASPARAPTDARSAAGAPGTCRGSPSGSFAPVANSQNSPTYAAGGEAYSYAGYGSSYSPYAAQPLAPLDGTSAIPAAVTTTAIPSECTSPVRLPAILTARGAIAPWTTPGLVALPSTGSVQRGTDLREPANWLIQTRDGPVVARLQSDGTYAFVVAPPPTQSSATGWRPWSGVDRPAVDAVWQSFATWWTEQGRAWPPS
jgi:hypothetical protein